MSEPRGGSHQRWISGASPAGDDDGRTLAGDDRPTIRAAVDVAVSGLISESGCIARPTLLGRTGDLRARRVASRAAARYLL